MFLLHIYASFFLFRLDYLRHSALAIYSIFVMKFKAISIVFFLVLFLGTEDLFAQQVGIIPKPNEIIRAEGSFIFNAGTSLFYEQNDSALLASLQPLREKISATTGYSLKRAATKPARNVIHVMLVPEIKEEGGYMLTVAPSSIVIKARDAVGVFYAVQSMLQMLPAEVESQTMVNNKVWQIPSVTINDAPAFRYRGLMLDVSRHFMPMSFLKRLVDLMAMQKMNNLHLHLTDDQGWRIEIKKYPRLTTVGSVRAGTLYNKHPIKGNDNAEYRGYYTQAEIRELVTYAARKFINIVPEIELPGHSSAAIAAYPALSCFPEESSPVTAGMHSKSAQEKVKVPGTKIVQETWGVFNDVLCPTDYTFQFMQDVVDEVIELFPSKYIHIGGDECPKDSWKRSSFCQDLIRKNNLKDEHGLQAYFIQRIEKHINSRGRSIIGWDEILEGGLAPNATVMSWRGTAGGIESAKQGHDVIMSPDGYCYLNFYQSEDPTDSIAWGGYLSLKRVYSYDPIPRELEASKQHFIMGVQGNLWSEYITSTALAEYMLFPRAVALAEVGWTRSKPGFENFTDRLIPFLKRLDQHGVNYSRHVYELSLQSRYITGENAVRVSIEGVPRLDQVRYRITNGQGVSEQKRYAGPFTVAASAAVEASVEVDGKVIDRATANFNVNKATGREISFVNQPAPAYNKGGAMALVNGIIGSTNRYTDNEWLGWEGKDFEAVIRLGEPTEVSKVSMRFFSAASSWVYPPADVAIFGSQDGKTFTELAVKNMSGSSDGAVVVKHFQISPARITHLKLVAKNHGIIGKSNPGEGYPAWLFVDEVVVE